MSDPTIGPGGARDGTRTGKGVGFGRSVAFSAARGALLIGIAVIIGIVLLQVIDDGSSGPIGNGSVSAGGTTDTTTPSSSGGGESPTSSCSTTSESRVNPPAAVAVLVLNGSGRPGAATAQSNALKAKGYQTLTPADTAQRQGNIVYFKAGFDRECTTVATNVDGAPKVEAVPSPPPTGSESASCVVILGS
jgi:hypothetical protein